MTLLSTTSSSAIPNLPTPHIQSNRQQSLFASIPLGQELSPLKSQLQELMSKYPFLSAGVFVMDAETGNYVSINGDRVFPAASTIKLPILFALFEAVDAGGLISMRC